MVLTVGRSGNGLMMLLLLVVVCALLLLAEDWTRGNDAMGAVGDMLVTNGALFLRPRPIIVTHTQLDTYWLLRGLDTDSIVPGFDEYVAIRWSPQKRWARQHPKIILARLTSKQPTKATKTSQASQPLCFNPKKQISNLRIDNI